MTRAYPRRSDHAASRHSYRRCTQPTRGNATILAALEGRPVTCGSRKYEPVDSIAYFWMVVDPWIHGPANPVYVDVGDYIGPIAAVFAGGECGAAESVVSVSEIGTKATN